MCFSMFGVSPEERREVFRPYKQEILRRRLLAFLLDADPGDNGVWLEVKGWNPSSPLLDAAIELEIPVRLLPRGFSTRINPNGRVDIFYDGETYGKI
jgi:hypothetical protein